MRYSWRNNDGWAVTRIVVVIATLLYVGYGHWLLATLLGMPLWLRVACVIALAGILLLAFRAWHAGTDNYRENFYAAMALSCLAAAAGFLLPHLHPSALALGVISSLLGVCLVLAAWRVARPVQ